MVNFNKPLAIVAVLVLPAAVLFADITIPVDTYSNHQITFPTSPPWLSATFSQAGTGVSLNLSAPSLPTPGQYQILYWDFSYTGLAQSLNFTPSSGSGLDSATYFGYNPGNWNIEFVFSPAFTGPLSILINAPSNAMLPVADFGGAFPLQDFHASNPPLVNTFATITDNMGGFANIYNSGLVVAAPEPMTYICLATLLTLVAVATRRRVARGHSSG